MVLRHVLTPIKIGGIEIPNRVVRTGHGTDIGRYKMDENLIAYHLARAKGGVGLSTVEWITVDYDSSPQGHLRIDDPDLISGYRKLMKAVKPYGMRMIQQVNHGGFISHRRDDNPAFSSSSRPGPHDGIPALPLSKDQIQWIVQRFADAAAATAEGGLDGVEIHGAHGYLLQQFLSPLHNRRTDEYGGSLENRMRLLFEVLSAVRARVPSREFIIGVRLSPEFIKGGSTTDECAQIAQRIEAHGVANFLNISLGSHYNLPKIVAPMNEPVGYQLSSTIPVVSGIRMPRILIGRFRTLEEADQVIGRGEADLVGMTRAHIADPDIVRKTREGREDEIRPCIGCNQGCVQGNVRGLMGCSINVAVGYEVTLAEDLIEKVSTPKRVLVVGGGPAGLEAARVAALRGHKVVLVEATPDLGGAINIAARAPRRQAIGDIIDWLTREIYRLGVEVRLSTYMAAEDVRAENPDAVIVATGSIAVPDGFQLHAPDDVPSGIDLPTVVTSADIIVGGAKASNGIAVVFDDTGHYEPIAAAEHLIEHGHKVTYVTGHHSFAPKLLGTLSEEPALERLARTGRFRLLTRYQLISIEPDKITVAPLYAPQQVEEIPATMLAYIGINKPNRDLAEELADYPNPVILVGDAKSPRFLQVAIREGHLAARTL